MDKKWDITPKASGRWSKLYVSLKPDGVLRICRKTHELLGSPEAVLLLYNQKDKTIGITPTTPDAENAFRNGPRGRHGGREIRAHQLLTRHKISLPYCVRFESPTLDAEHVLNLDLRNVRPVRREDRAFSL